MSKRKQILNKIKQVKIVLADKDIPYTVAIKSIAAIILHKV